MLGLESVTSNCSSQHPVLHSLEASEVTQPHVSAGSSLLSHARSQEPGAWEQGGSSPPSSVLRSVSALSLWAPAFHSEFLGPEEPPPPFFFSKPLYSCVWIPNLREVGRCCFLLHHPPGSQMLREKNVSCWLWFFKYLSSLIPQLPGWVLWCAGCCAMTIILHSFIFPFITLG